MPDHGGGFRGQGRSLPEIGKDALAEVAGLAHIDDPPLRVLIDIDAGRGRKVEDAGRSMRSPKKVMKRGRMKGRIQFTGWWRPVNRLRLALARSRRMRVLYSYPFIFFADERPVWRGKIPTTRKKAS